MISVERLTGTSSANGEQLSIEVFPVAISAQFKEPRRSFKGDPANVVTHRARSWRDFLIPPFFWAWLPEEREESFTYQVIREPKGDAASLDTIHIQLRESFPMAPFPLMTRRGETFKISVVGTAGVRSEFIRFLTLVREVTTIAEGKRASHRSDALEWLIQNLADMRTRYSGQWIAIAGNEVVAASTNLTALLHQVHESGIEDPFITEIPEGPVIWATAYAR